MSNHQHTLIIDGTSGISGDMTVAALLDLGASEEHLREQLATLPVDGFSIAVTRANKHGIDACDFDVQLAEELENHDHDMAWLYGNEAAAEHTHEHEHHHHHHDEDEHDHDHCCHHHDHDDDDDDDHDHEHCCHHHHDEDEHDHDHHHHHHDGEECDDPHCGCHHHHHHADEVFTSWGTETVKAYSEAELEHILTALDSGEYGAILRAKGIVAAADGGQWLHYDFVPEEHQVRRGPADYTGRICVIGSQLKEDKLSQLFGL